MNNIDARKVDHKTMEAIRIPAVEQLQPGERTEIVFVALRFSRASIYNWLAPYRVAHGNPLCAIPLKRRMIQAHDQQSPHLDAANAGLASIISARIHDQLSCIIGYVHM